MTPSSSLLISDSSSDHVTEYCDLIGLAEVMTSLRVGEALRDWEFPRQTHRGRCMCRLHLPHTPTHPPLHLPTHPATPTHTHLPPHIPTPTHTHPYNYPPSPTHPYTYPLLPLPTHPYTYHSYL